MADERRQDETQNDDEVEGHLLKDGIVGETAPTEAQTGQEEPHPDVATPQRRADSMDF